MICGLGSGVGFAGAVPAAPWVPSDLGATLEMDLDAAHVTLTGGKVSTWPDQTANGHDANQADPAVQPTVDALGGFDGKDAVYWNLTTWMQIDTALACASTHAFVVLCNVEDPAVHGYDAIWRFSTCSDIDHFVHNSGWAWLAFNTSARKSFDPSLALTSPRCLEIISRADWWEARLDGVSESTTIVNNLAWRTPQYLGNTNLGWGLGAAYGYYGWMARILVCNDELTGADLALMRAYLTAQYGVTFA